jgi:hypothetical protein
MIKTTGQKAVLQGTPFYIHIADRKKNIIVYNRRHMGAAEQRIRKLDMDRNHTPK